MAQIERTTETVAYEYGRACAVRDWHSHYGNIAGFKKWDDTCHRLWLELIQLSAYQDEGASRLKDEYREHYWTGIDDERKGRFED